MEDTESIEVDVDIDVAYPADADIDDAVATLTLSRDDEYIKTITLRRGDQLCVGRKALEKEEEHVRLQIKDPIVSKDQFRIYMVLYDDDATTSYMFYCEDLETLNGTDVNGTIIGSRSNPGAPFLLTDGDKIFVQPDWNFVFNQMAGSHTAKLGDMQREDSLFFKDRYHISNRCLGSGQYSKVLLAKDVTTMKQLACKVMDLTKSNNERERERLLEEVNLLGKLNHPNIVTLQKAFQSDESLFLFLDLAPGGDLMSFVSEYGGILSDTYTLVIIRQVTLAVDYLHSQDIVHRDLKPENILVMYNDIGHRVVVADFGCASVLRSAKRMDSFVGTANYLAPEVHEGQIVGGRAYTKAVDLWSLGILTFILLTGESMIDFEERRVDQRAVRARLEQPGYDDASAQRWREVSALAKDFMAKLLVVNPRTRMTAHEAVKHDWFTKDKKMERELKQLYERANKDWKPRTIEKDVLEIIPGASRDADENSPPKARRLPNMNASRYFGLDKHLRSYDQSQREEAARTKQKLIDQLKEMGETFIQTTDMSTYTPKKPKPNVQFSLTSQGVTTSPHTPKGAQPRIETPRTPTKGRKTPAIRQVDARDMFADSPEEAHSPSRKPIRESQIPTQGEDESQILLSQRDTQRSMLLAAENTESPSLGREHHRAAGSTSSASFSIIHSLTIRKKTPEPESVLPPEPTGSSLEIEKLLQQQFSSVNTDIPMSESNTEGILTARNEKRKVQVFEDKEEELPVNPAAPKKRAAARHITLTQEEQDLRRDVLKTLPYMTSAKKYGQQIKEKKQGLIPSGR